MIFPLRVFLLTAALLAQLLLATASWAQEDEVPALDVEKVVFRLFQTKEFGQDYKLP